MPSVLIVDDLLSIHEMLDAVIQPTGFSTSFATDGEKALARYKAEKPDLVLADIDMKPMDGITLLKQLKLHDANAVVIIMTAYASTDSALQALKFGAFDYLQKPFRVDELIKTLKRGHEFRQFSIAEKVASAAPFPTSRGGGGGGGYQQPQLATEDRIVGAGAKFKRLQQQIKKLSSVRTPVLLQGEVGTGKSTIGEVLHGMSSAPDAPFVRIDCSLNSEENFRAGLLGEGGAGGTWIEKAKGGTLFLHNLQGLPLPMQKELVSVLRATSSGFRLVCTTTEDLEKLTDEGSFNDELFYRVASLPLVVPSLRDRTDDLPALIKHFVSRATNPYFNTSELEFTDDAMDVFNTYHWPGNVTELNQVVTKIASTVESRIVTSKELPMRIKEVKDWSSLADFLAGQQKQYIDQVLRACRDDKAKAAKVLGIDASKIK